VSFIKNIRGEYKMKLKSVFMLLILSMVMTGCNSEPKTYDAIWVDSSISSQETIDSAIERLSDAKIDFIIDDSGNILIDENDLNKAVMCCS
jgi:flagellar biosynthesis/type III secretory pathway M-ring protein FliF/YscJ